MNCSPPALSMEFPRQEYCSELLFPSPGGLPDPGGRTRVSCIGRRILYCWAIREAQTFIVTGFLQNKQLVGQISVFQCDLAIIHLYIGPLTSQLFHFLFKSSHFSLFLLNICLFSELNKDWKRGMWNVIKVQCVTKHFLHSHQALNNSCLK